MSLILALDNCRFHCSHVTLTSPSYFHCKLAGGMNHNGMAGINIILLFQSLALDSKAGIGLAIPLNSTAGYITISIYTGVGHAANYLDRRLDGVWLVSWPLFE